MASDKLNGGPHPTLNIWRLQPVRQAAMAILHAAQLVRLEHPEMPVRRRLQEARRQCPAEILQASLAITRAEELAKHGTWQVMPPSRGSVNGRDILSHTLHREARQQATAARYRRIGEVAAANPDWSHRRIGEYFGCSSTTVGTALARATATIVPPGSTSPAVGQRQPVAPPSPAKTAD